MTYKEQLKSALRITHLLLQNKAVSMTGEYDLYTLYMSDMTVQELVYTILESYDLTLIEYKKALYVSPGIDNTVFGYKNETLRNIMNLESNKELYLCYFIMYTIMTIFYKESSFATYKDYITSTEVVDRVTATLEAFSVEDTTQEEAYTFTNLKRFWEELTQISLHQTEETLESLRRTNSQFFFVTRSLHFLCLQNLLIKNEQERNYMPTERFKALIANYFANREVKNALMHYGETLLQRGDSANASY